MTPLRLLSVLVSVLLTALVATPVRAQNPEPHGDVIVHTPDEARWTAAPRSLPPGAEYEAIVGDPARPGPYTVRLRLPAGYEVAPHRHGEAEHVTVLRGVLNVGIGEALTRTGGFRIPAGGFVRIAAGTPHFMFAEGETVIQLHGEGPFGFDYVNPADAPRNR
jgi:hypothetical protein